MDNDKLMMFVLGWRSAEACHEIFKYLELERVIEEYQHLTGKRVKSAEQLKQETLNFLFIRDRLNG